MFGLCPLLRSGYVPHYGFSYSAELCTMPENQALVEQPITVVLADDHPLLREALKAVLERQHDIKVVGEANNGEDAVRVVLELLPRVAILDISMPKLSGIEAAQAIKSQCPEVAILVLTVHEDSEIIRRVLEIGVAGYLTKDALGDQVVQAVRTVASGDITLSPSVLSSVVTGAETVPTTTSGDNPLLTARELHILRLTASGLTNTQMAAECGFSPRTVRGYLGSIFAKLRVANRTEAVSAALHLGIISVSDLRQSNRDG